MPTPSERLASSRAKVARAKQHITDLEKAIVRFRDTKPYDIKTEDHPETGQYVKRLVKADAIPLDIPAIVGDILFDLRSALDHLAYQLVLFGSPTALTDVQAKQIYFPIGNDSTHLITLLQAQIKGSRADAVKRITEIEPYKGGKGHVLWTLKTLNDSDKHRLLVTAVCAPERALIDTIDVAQSAKAMGLPIVWAIRLAQRSKNFFRFHVTASRDFNTRPLKLGDVVLTGALERKAYERVHFVLQIALNEPGIVEGKSVLETMKHMVDFVDAILPTFESCFSE